MSEFKFNCPHCGQHLKSDESAAGRQIQCPSCDHLIRIPAVPGQTANYQPESGATWATHVGAGRAAPPENLSIKPNPSSNQKGS
jgi:DNA-directed RNA polymerase subunit RPC12/RpoP